MFQCERPRAALVIASAAGFTAPAAPAAPAASHHAPTSISARFSN